MALFSGIFTDTATIDGVAEQRTRYGAPGQRPATARHERNEYREKTDSCGSHMPIDTGIHWEWRNPLNILPALILFLLIVALVATVWA
jgi:hypothetical protein